MSRYYVYAIVNRINNKLYVGKTNNPTVRWQDHKKVALGGREKYSEDFFAIHAALHKYGIDNFRFEIVDEFDSEDEAYRAETQYILLLCSNLKKFGYNCNLGGEGGIKPTEDIMKKLIAAQNRPHIKAIKSDLMKKRHQANPRFLGVLQAKLTESQVLEVRDKYHRGIAGYLKLAKEYGVSTGSIRKIISRKTWSHI